MLPSNVGKFNLDLIHAKERVEIVVAKSVGQGRSCSSETRKETKLFVRKPEDGS